MPSHLRSNFLATYVVVPVPTKGSSTKPSHGENNLITRRANSSGNSASCRPFFLTERICQTPLDPHSDHHVFPNELYHTQ